MTDTGRDFREHGNKGIYFRGTRELRSENEGNRGTKSILGNVGNDNFDFGQRGNKATQPEQDKTNKRIGAHGEDADQPGHPPSLIRVFACIQWVATDPRFLRADSELWSDRVYAQINLSLHLAGHFDGSAMRRLNLLQGIKGIDSPDRERTSCIL